MVQFLTNYDKDFVSTSNDITVTLRPLSSARLTVVLSAIRTLFCLFTNKTWLFMYVDWDKKKMLIMIAMLVWHTGARLWWYLEFALSVAVTIQHFWNNFLLNQIVDPVSSDSNYQESWLNMCFSSVHLNFQSGILSVHWNYVHMASLEWIFDGKIMTIHKFKTLCVKRHQN